MKNGCQFGLSTLVAVVLASGLALFFGWVALEWATEGFNLYYAPAWVVLAVFAAIAVLGLVFVLCVGVVVELRARKRTGASSKGSAEVHIEPRPPDEPNGVG